MVPRNNNIWSYLTWSPVIVELLIPVSAILPLEYLVQDYSTQQRLLFSYSGQG